MPTRKEMEQSLWLFANISEPDLAEMTDHGRFNDPSALTLNSQID